MLPRPGLFVGDCIQHMKNLDDGCVDLVFADPPFNIGFKYDVYDDHRSEVEYLDFSRAWMCEVHRILKPNGTFWLAINDEYAAELKLIATREIRFHCRSWVIWHYTFGVHCTRKFSRSHTHLFHFVKNPKKFTFNVASIKVPSARQTVYHDKRARADGRMPDDTWILRPQQVHDGFKADHDTWHFPKIAGTFKERAGFHGCQMPEQLLSRIITVSSNPGEWVFDSFAGSGTTLVVAKRLGRQWMGFELSPVYARMARKRLKRAVPKKKAHVTQSVAFSARPP